MLMIIGVLTPAGILIFYISNIAVLYTKNRKPENGSKNFPIFARFEILKFEFPLP